MNSCTACGTSLNFFTRKKCPVCTQPHCSRCFTSTRPPTPDAPMRPTRSGPPRRACVKCAMLVSGDYTREDLVLRYTVRELRAFLVARLVHIGGCTEKSDLVELVMKMSRAPNRSGYHSDDIEHTMHVTKLKEKMMSEIQSDVPSTPSADRVPRNSDSGVNVGVSSSGRSATQSGSFTVTSEIRVTAASNSNVPFSNNQSRSTANSENTPDFRAPASVAGDQNRLDFENVTINAEVRASSTTEAENLNGKTEPSREQDCLATFMCRAQPVLSTPTVHRRVTLDELTSIDLIEQLTVRQLKELLVNNFVDYRGCCERKELVERVRQLWADRRRNAATYAASGNAVDEPTDADDAGRLLETNDVCKICMDAMIDCILLECGHMVTCTDCGKRLAECPICRRYVSRAVHVFRA